MRDEKGLRRQWALLRSLTSRHVGLTIRQMADEVGVTQRTIRRDLDVFRSVGFPLEEQVGDFGLKTWRIRGGRDQPALSFTFEEAAALYLGRRLLEPLAGTLFWEAARGASQKIRAALGTSAMEYLDGFATFFHQSGVGIGDYGPKAELIEELLVAIEDAKVARLLYRSEKAPEPTGRDVHPYGVVYHRGALYLIALDADQGLVKHYKVDRIESVETTSTAFTRPESFDLSAHMSSAFGVYRGGEPIDVVVCFAPAVARYVQEARRHGSQELTTQPDGSVLARFTVSGTEEIKRWVLGFGSKAVIQEPDWLRREVVEELRAMTAAYATPESGTYGTATEILVPTTVTPKTSRKARVGRRVEPKE
jgi:predicted DNA-binding transcriptional regulator YafY